MVLHPHRVGLIGSDGKPTWHQFSSYHGGEAISRAVRQANGVKFHDLHPGKSVWNQRIGRFQYRCAKHHGEFGTLVERLGDDGSIEYVCPVCRPGAAIGLPEARVTASVSLSSPEIVSEMLVLTGMAKDLPEHFTSTAHICDRCQHYAIEARLRTGRVETRCPMCDVE